MKMGNLTPVSVKQRWKVLLQEASHQIHDDELSEKDFMGPWNPCLQYRRLLYSGLA